MRTKLKILAPLALFSLLSVGACTKIHTEEGVITATFSPTFYDEGRFPTKGFMAEISDALPESIPLTLTNKTTSVEYIVNSGESITLPLGTYEVKGGTTPQAVQFVSGTQRYLSRTPKISVEDEIELVVGQSAYSVNARYESFALGVLPSEVSKWSGRFKGNIAEVSYIEADGLWWTFVTGNLDPNNLFYTTITPLAGADRSFSIITSGTYDGAMLVEYGKWYVLHPSGASTQSGTFDLGLPDWIAG